MKILILAILLSVMGCKQSAIKTEACMDAWRAFCAKATECEGLVTGAECMAEVVAGNVCADINAPLVELHACSVDIPAMKCGDPLPSTCFYFRQ